MTSHDDLEPDGIALSDEDRRLVAHWAAARAVCYAAATPYTHALATPHQSKHPLGPAVYQAQARELAAGNDPSVGDEEIRWAIEHASPTVREVVRRFPGRSRGRSRLATLFYQLDVGLSR